MKRLTTIIAALALAGCATVPVEDDEKRVPWGWIVATGVGVAAAIALAQDDDAPQDDERCVIRVGPDGSDTICR